MMTDLMRSEVVLTPAGVLHHQVEGLLRLDHLKQLHWEGPEEKGRS